MQTREDGWLDIVDGCSNLFSCTKKFLLIILSVRFSVRPNVRQKKGLVEDERGRYGVREERGGQNGVGGEDEGGGGGRGVCGDRKGL